MEQINMANFDHKLLSTSKILDTDSQIDKTITHVKVDKATSISSNAHQVDIGMTSVCNKTRKALGYHNSEDLTTETNQEVCFEKDSNTFIHYNGTSKEEIKIQDFINTDEKKELQTISHVFPVINNCSKNVKICTIWPVNNGTEENVKMLTDVDKDYNESQVQLFKNIVPLSVKNVSDVPYVVMDNSNNGNKHVKTVASKPPLYNNVEQVQQCKDALSTNRDSDQCLYKAVSLPSDTFKPLQNGVDIILHNNYDEKQIQSANIVLVSNYKNNIAENNTDIISLYPKQGSSTLVNQWCSNENVLSIEALIKKQFDSNKSNEITGYNYKHKNISSVKVKVCAEFETKLNTANSLFRKAAGHTQYDMILTLLTNCLRNKTTFKGSEINNYIQEDMNSMIMPSSHSAREETPENLGFMHISESSKELNNEKTVEKLQIRKILNEFYNTQIFNKDGGGNENLNVSYPINSGQSNLANSAVSHDVNCDSFNLCNVQGPTEITNYQEGIKESDISICNNILKADFESSLSSDEDIRNSIISAQNILDKDISICRNNEHESQFQCDKIIYDEDIERAIDYSFKKYETLTVDRGVVATPSTCDQISQTDSCSCIKQDSCKRHLQFEDEYSSCKLRKFTDKIRPEVIFGNDNNVQDFPTKKSSLFETNCTEKFKFKEFSNNEPIFITDDNCKGKTEVREEDSLYDEEESDHEELNWSSDTNNSESVDFDQLVPTPQQENTSPKILKGYDDETSPNPDYSDLELILDIIKEASECYRKGEKLYQLL